MSRSLRLKSFQPEEKYVYLMYSIKNDRKEESRALLENYRSLLQGALDWLWGKVRVERKEVRRGGRALTRVKITLPKKGEVYRELRDRLERSNALASHYADAAINDAYSILKGWRRRAERGRAAIRRPRLRSAYVRVKSTLMKVEGESVRVTVRPHEYITFSWSRSWFSSR
ncbi:MAG: RNA-guided endonuclease TnpB family protein, partial [Acidilobus sp.]